MPLSSITSLLEAELAAMNDIILSALQSHVETINQIGHYLINSGGKRIRPLIVLLSAKACEAQGESPLVMAAVIEFIHTATLLHDDVVDGSKLRRGHLTAHHVWDNPSAILVGDFLYSRAFQMMVSLNSLPSMQILADATNKIAEGEVLQLAHRYQPDTDETRYLHVIELKTAKLFEAAAQLGAILTGSLPWVKALGAFGKHIGMAFQLVDDALDYQTTNPAWGKNVGTDLAEGKATLPLIYALQKATPAQAQQIREAVQTGKISDLGVIQETIVATGAMDYVMERARQEAEKAMEALSVLGDSPYREAMFQLAQFAVSRRH